MPDDYRECTKSMMACLWALSLFGAEQLVRILAPRDAGPARLEAAALAAVTHTTEAQFGEVSREVFQAGDQLQRGMVNLMFRLVTLDALTTRHMTKMTFEVMQQSAGVVKLLIPGRDTRLAWQEFQNKLQAFDLFEHVDVTLNLASEFEISLPALVEKAEGLGPYLAVWASEGLGRYYAETHWESQGTPQHLLTADHVRTLPLRSLIPLHTGMGISLADHLLATLKPQSPASAVDTTLRQFIALCEDNSRAGYTGAVLEALGLVTRLRYPQIIRIVDGRLSAIAPDVLGYFWHGVGRGLYFLPINALPCSSATWRAVGMAHEEAPHTLGRLNALGGLAWAVTLVNIRHPVILEAFLQQYGEALVDNDAFSTGVSAALMIWYDIEGSDPYLRAFLQHQPDPSHPPLVQRWNSQVSGPSQQALQRYYGVLKARQGLGEVFQHQPLSALVERLQGEPLR
jgi:hypothetical protein